MSRTKIADRILPAYTTGEEIFNMVSHIVGAVFGIAALVLTVICAAMHHNVWGVVGSAIYGATMILLYTMSSVYHGLRPNRAKKVMQVIDHCTIFLLISGTYTPITLVTLREYNPLVGWLIFGIVWFFAILGIVLNAIDLKSFRKFSMICYLGMGWCIVFAIRPVVKAVPLPGLLLLTLGGVFYTVGAVLYGLGKKKRWMHSIFHLFVVFGSIAHFFAIQFYVL